MKSQRLLLTYYHIDKFTKKRIESISLFIARIYLFNVFFIAGLTKLRDWESTLFLFEYEYSVPLLSPQLAAYLGTGTELILPTLILIGLFSSASAIGLFIFNIVAVFSLEEMSNAAMLLHVIWGLLIFCIMVWGAGKLSVDHFIQKTILKQQN